MTPVTDSVQAMLEELELDRPGEALAAIAVALAGKLDAASRSTSGAVAVAASGLAKELRSVLSELLEGREEPDELLLRLFPDRAAS